MTKEGALSPAVAGRNGRRGAAATGAGGRSPGPELPAAAAWSFPRKSAAPSLRPEGAAPHRRAVAGRALRHIRQASPQAPRPEASETASALLPLLFRLGDACAHLNGRCAAMALAARDRRLDRKHVIDPPRSEEHTSETKSLMRISYA